MGLALCYSFLCIAFILQQVGSQPICSPGSYLENDKCIKCPKGQFQNKPGRRSCKFCPLEKVTLEVGSTKCTRCPKYKTPNSLQNACDCLFKKDNGKCEPCDSGQFLRTFFDPPLCETCGRTKCISCKEGEVLVNDDQCGKCPPGKDLFRPDDSNSKRDTSCVPCFPGTFKPSVGQTPCRKCPKNGFSRQGATECIFCPKGQALMKDDSCKSCRPGQYYLVGFEKCLSCQPGTFQPEESARTRCKKCPKGSFSLAGATKCINCPPGQVLLKTDGCRECPPGSRYVPLLLKCSPCFVNTFGNKSTGFRCKKCPRRSFSRPGASKCIACPKGQVLFRDGTCIVCPAGTTYDKFNAVCRA